MKWTSLSEIRKLFLNFFEQKGHEVLPSFSLVPKDDNSLLLINSGMAPMKKFFTGALKPPAKMVATCQKCIRTPDIDRVGLTARHGTYFEMLGNFSFGSYFKKEAIAWAWEFCTKVLHLPEDRVWVSVYEGDDEAFDIWVNEVGFPPERMVKLGKKDNFWEHGAGPCGPCSELYFDRGEKYGCGQKNCAPGCDCDRFVEFWNLVFTQFESDGQGEYTPLKSPNIDTGLGLERLACIMQQEDNLFLIDSVQNIMRQVSQICNITYGTSEKADISLRVMTDHIRSGVFMMCDKVIPSNEGRGYVLRRLIRRAARHGKLLGIKELFLEKVAKTVIEQNSDAYPELLVRQKAIRNLIHQEEENFAKTIDQGLIILNRIVEGSSELSGEDAFKLHDTYGFPLGLTKEILAERRITVDEKRFKQLLQEQKERARNARKNTSKEAWLSEGENTLQLPATEFLGYKNLEISATVLAVIPTDEKNEVLVVLDKTPFYAEAGGQRGDKGTITTQTADLQVIDTQKTQEGVYLHRCEILGGFVSKGEIVCARVCARCREKIKRNHTAAHLLHAALREVLGEHVTQAGQSVTENELRFDFSHLSALTDNEILKVEQLVNQKIFEHISVINDEMTIKEAKEKGAMALFEEKYGNIVRTVKIGDFSFELCAGTHAENTSFIGAFKIVSESSVAAGVRRIEARTSDAVLQVLRESLETINTCCSVLKVNDTNKLSETCGQIMREQKEKNTKINELYSRLARSEARELLAKAKNMDGIKWATKSFKNEDQSYLNTLCEKLKDIASDAAIVFFNITEGKAAIMVAAGNEAQKKGVHAGELAAKIANMAGGKGGGKPALAMAGTKDLQSLNKVMQSLEDGGGDGLCRLVGMKR